MEQAIQEKKVEKKEGTIVWLNRLRIFACILVILIHTSSRLRSTMTSFMTSEWCIGNVFNSLGRPAVPLFVMISGALFLDENKKLSLKKLLLHNVLRLVFIFFLWDYLLIILETSLLKGFSFDLFLYALKNLTLDIGHLWFLPMLIGLYLLTPILRMLCKKENKKIVEYFLIIFIVANLIINFTASFNILKPINYVFDVFSLMTPYLDINYIGIYVAGWYLFNFGFPKKYEKGIVIGACLVYLIYPIFDILVSQSAGRWLTLTSNNISIVNFIATCGIFMFFKLTANRHKPNKVLDKISDCTMGIYLIHMFMLELFFKLTGPYFQSLCISAWWGVLLLPVAVLAIFAMGLVVSFLFSLLPKKVRRWIM